MVLDFPRPFLNLLQQLGPVCPLSPASALNYNLADQWYKKSPQESSNSWWSLSSRNNLGHCGWGEKPQKAPRCPPPRQPPDTLPLSLTPLDPSGSLCMNSLPFSLLEANFPAAVCHILTKAPPSSSMPELGPSPSPKTSRKNSVQKLSQPGGFIMVSWAIIPLKQSAF